MIVVDVGCHEQPPEESVQQLIDRFQPELLLGFDPDPGLAEGIERIGETLVLRRRACVWTSSGYQPVEFKGICTGIDQRPERPTQLVPTVDIVGLVGALPPGVVLKLDCEGAELEILGALHDDGADRDLALVLVEWHPVDLGTDHGRGWTREQIVAFARELRCPVEEWAYATTPVLPLA